jgi:predicted Ser/Thr protein kinase
MDPKQFLAKLAEGSRERFVQEERVLSFQQYVERFAQTSHLLGRNATQYLKGVFDYYGESEIDSPTGRHTRFTLFDAPFDEGRDRLVGQEEVQEAFYRQLCDFVREGKASRLLLLHGPNGSAKTSFVQCIARAMVDYSRRPEGALYTFNWVFPKESAVGKRVGFASAEGGDERRGGSYAFLDESEIAALLPTELSDNPIFLIPREDRADFLASLTPKARGEAEGFRFSDHILGGDLSPVSRRIFEALLAAYDGDLTRVLAHVQVERFYFSRRYRRGVVTVEPQMHVDASTRQITQDESYGNLPAVLRHVSMFEMGGDLVDANRGLLEYSDMLKRPLDAYKYLLGTCENSKVTLAGAILYLDIVFVGTTNDKYVEAFKKMPDFPSFKGRMELVRVPYIRDYRVEAGIYDSQIGAEVAGKHIAPHATSMAALWAVLTRLKKPDASGASSAARDALGKLTPLQKADLYALGVHPAGLKADVAHELVQTLLQAHAEPGVEDYEGSFGASPREIKGLLLAAAHCPGFACLHPVRVFSEIDELCKQRSLYEFLQIAHNGAYHNPSVLLDFVKERYAECVDSEFKRAMGLVTDEGFEQLLQKYAIHASASIKKESVHDPITREPVPPDETFMRELEDKWGVTSDAHSRSRQDFIGRIASFSLDNPGLHVIYQRLFPTHFDNLRQAYFDERKSEIAKALKLVLDLLDGASLQPDEVESAGRIVQNMISGFGYCRQCLGPALSFLAGAEAK